MNKIIELIHERYQIHEPPISFDKPDGIDDDTEVIFNEEQFLRQQSTAHVTPLLLAYTPPLPFLATMEPLDTLLMRGEDISIILTMENDEFIKSNADNLVTFPRESEVTFVSTDLRESKVTLVSTDLRCSMSFDSPHLPYTNVLRDEKVDIDLPFGEQLETLSIGDREIDFNSLKDVEILKSFLDDDHVPVKTMFEKPL
nr:hypothetical protein [Tanacetum cinerariifolium]